jgi:DMSO/TMAO reductase YedYZ molybdopterin-dependent catalytic subunit
MKKPSLLEGALIGGLFTLPLAALFYLASQTVGLPFVPFDVLDWMARNLPGGVIRVILDLMVGLLTVLSIGVREAAKTAEQMLSLIGLVATGALAGLVLFAVLRGLERWRGLLGGLIAGVVFGVPVMLMSLAVNQSAAGGPAVSAIWIMVIFLLWGAATGYVYDYLRGPQRAGSAGEMMTVEQVERRRFLIRAGAATAVITVAGAGLGAVLAPRTRRADDITTVTPRPTVGMGAGMPAQGSGPAVHDTGAAELLARLPNADDPLQPAPGTRPEYTPLEDHFRLDINAVPPVIDGATWTLPITGMVDNSLTLTLADLQNNYPPLHQFVTLACISNPVGGNLIGTTLWTGVSLKQVLADARVQAGAKYLRITARDGYYETLALDLVNRDERIMLTYQWDGKPLSAKHGFPLRIYIPDVYGMKQPKWITGIEVTDTYEEGFWVARNWDEVARVQTTSVIDTVAVEDVFEQDGQRFVPIGGIAHAGARGISKVEVKVDDGEWVEARLRRPLSGQTWVVWRYDWPFSPGQHTFTVRCEEGDGTPQSDLMAGTFPAGATGYHRLRKNL